MILGGYILDGDIPRVGFFMGMEFCPVFLIRLFAL